MRYKVRYCLKQDLFTHRENIYKNWEDFSSSFWFFMHQSSDYKCIHIYMLPDNYDVEFCDEELENVSTL